MFLISPSVLRAVARLRGEVAVLRFAFFVPTFGAGAVSGAAATFTSEVSTSYA